MKKKFLKLSLILFIMGVFILAISYFFFHFVTDTGVSLVWQSEPGKPFVTEMLGDLSVLCIFSSILSLIVAYVFNEEEK